MSKQSKLNDYDSEPVNYCTKCYSLGIKYEESIGMDCCSQCGCTDFKTTSFFEWEKLYMNRYGHKYVEKTNDVRMSPIFQLSPDKLKARYSMIPIGERFAQQCILLSLIGSVSQTQLYCCLQSYIRRIG